MSDNGASGKPNYWFLPKIDLAAERRCFGDPDDPEGHFRITLRPLTVPEASISGARAQELAARFCGIDPRTNQPRFLLSPLGEHIVMSEEFVSSLAMIEAMQQETAEGERIDFFQLVALSLRLPGPFQEMLIWSGQRQQEAGLGKRSAPSGAPSSEPPSPASSPILSG